jgi:hypothetical protein
VLGTPRAKLSRGLRWYVSRNLVPIPDTQVRSCLKAVGAFLARRRPPPDARAQLDFRADIAGSDLVVVEVRPAYNDKRRIIEHPLAKAKWVDKRKVWRLFWMRSDLKWHSYSPMPEARTIGSLLAEVDRDPHGCFFG